MFAALPKSARIVDEIAATSLDRSDLLQSIGSRAEELRLAGARRGDRVAIAHGSGSGVLIDLFACWRIGACAVLLTNTLTDAEHDNVIEQIVPAVWIGDRSTTACLHLPPARGDAGGIGSAVDLPDDATLDEPALVLMTSGTTARPKGVVHTRRSLLARIALNISHIPPAELARSLSLLPMHFGHGLIGNCLTPLFAGATLVLQPSPGWPGLARLGETIDRHGISFMSSVPSLWRVALKASPPPTKGTLLRVHVGSAPLSAGLWREIISWAGTNHVVNMYGITETANWIGGFDAASGDPADALVGSAWGGAFRIRLGDGSLAAVGRGEIVVSTPGVMTGYLDRPDLTAAALTGDWFSTGDIGELDDNGALRIVGRLKHEINRGGIKIAAEEIDLLLERHPDIVDACAFALPDPVSGEMVAAAVVLRPDSAVTGAEIKDWCRTMIRAEAVPERIFALPAIPRNERGKPDRSQTREACTLPPTLPASST